MKVYILYEPAYAEHGCADWMVDTKFLAIHKDRKVIEQLEEDINKLQGISSTEIEEMDLPE